MSNQKLEPEDQNQSTTNELDDFPTEYVNRVKTAFKDKDGRRVLRSIKSKFPELRTADLNMKLIMIQEGALVDNDILKEVESVTVD